MRIRARMKVLDYIRGHPGTQADQIARALGMSPGAVRHHLGILRLDGRIDAATGRPGPGRGRPRLGYRASEGLVGNNLAMLAEHLLSSWKVGAGGGRRQAALVAGLAGKLREQLRPPAATSSTSRKLGALVERLSQLHYRSRWEAGAEGPRLIFGHCPYAAVVERHPELCKMDARAVAAIMNARVEQRAKIDPQGRGPMNCVFVLKYV